MLEVIGRFANNWNMSGHPEDFARLGAAVNRAALVCGRDPTQIRWSVGLDSWPFESAALFSETVHGYAAAGVRDFMMNWPEPRHHVSVRRIARAVIPELRAI